MHLRLLTFRSARGEGRKRLRALRPLPGLRGLLRRVLQPQGQRPVVQGHPPAGQRREALLSQQGTCVRIRQKWLGCWTKTLFATFKDAGEKSMSCPYTPRFRSAQILKPCVRFFLLGRLKFIGSSGHKMRRGAALFAQTALSFDLRMQKFYFSSPALVSYLTALYLRFN